MQKLLIIGADGVVGANLALSLSDRFSVVAAHHAEAFTMAGLHTTHCDLRDARGLGELVRSESPDWTIFCGRLSTPSWDIADTDVDLLASEPETALAVAQAVEGRGGRFTAISTDAVFEGPAMFHAEDSPATAATPFAQFALANGSESCRQRSAGCSDARLRLEPIGRREPFCRKHPPTLAGRPRGVLRLRRHATPIFAGDLAESLLAAYQRSLQGVLHVAGAERTNPRRFSCEVAAAFGITNVRWLRGDGEAETAATTPRETSLLTRAAQRALGTPAPMLRDGLARWARQLASGYCERLQTSQPAAALAAA